MTETIPALQDKARSGHISMSIIIFKRQGGGGPKKNVAVGRYISTRK